MSAQPSYFQKEIVSSALPLWRESLTAVDWLALRYAPVYYGVGVPRGDGSAVVLVPGFMADDYYLLEMFYWLQRIGYKPYLSRIGRNVNCLDVSLERLLNTVERAQRQTGKKVHVIGHSLGGVLARSLTGLRPDLIASVITLASPFRGISSHQFVAKAAEKVRERILKEGSNAGKNPNCFTNACSCSAASSLRGGLNSAVPRTAIYTKTDGVVDWHFCINNNPANNFEVIGTHIGLAFNPFVYQLIGTRLDWARHQAEGPHPVQPKKAS